MDSKTKVRVFGCVSVVLIIGAITYHKRPEPALSRLTQPANQVGATGTPERRLQIHDPRWNVTGTEGMITIITGFSETGQLIVATTHGDETCGIGQTEVDGKYDPEKQQFIGGDVPNNNPIFLTIYRDGSNGRIQQGRRDGSTESCPVSVTIKGQQAR